MESGDVEYVCGTKLGETGRGEELQMRWSTCTRPNMHTDTYTHTLTPQMRQLSHQTLSLARGIAVWVVGEELRRGAEEEERGN